MAANRKSIVNDEHRAESAALLKLWNRARKKMRDAGEKPLAQGPFGSEYEIGTQGAVWQFLHGHVALSYKAARGFAKGLRCSIADFSPRLAAMREEEVEATDDQEEPSPNMALLRRAAARRPAAKKDI